MANTTIQGETPKGSALQTTDLFESEVQVSPGVYVTRSQTGQNIIDGVKNVLGPFDYKGTWNADTNTPTLASGVGTKGDVYKVSVAGATDLDGITDWQPNDLLLFDGTVWDKIDNTETSPPLNLIYVCNDGNDATGLTTGKFLTLSGMYAAISPDVDHQYIIFDVRGKATESSNIEPKPYTQTFGFGTDLTFNTMNLSSVWDALTEAATAAFGYYESLRSGGAGITLDFRNCVLPSGMHDFFLTGNRSKLDAGLKVFGVWGVAPDPVLPHAALYMDDSNSADIVGGNDTWIELDYGIQALLTDSQLAQLKVRNNNSTPSLTKVTVKDTPIYGRSSTGVGVELTGGTIGADVQLNIENSRNFATTTAIALSTISGAGIATLTMDAPSFVAPVISGTGVLGQDYFIYQSTNQSGINNDTITYVGHGDFVMPNWPYSSIPPKRTFYIEGNTNDTITLPDAPVDGEELEFINVVATSQFTVIAVPNGRNLYGNLITNFSGINSVQGAYINISGTSNVQFAPVDPTQIGQYINLKWNAALVAWLIGSNFGYTF